MILDYFADEKITVSYTPVGSTEINEDTGQLETVPGTPVDKSGLFWDRSAASRYFSEQIAASVESYFVPDTPGVFWNDDGTPNDTGSIEIDGTVYTIETVQNIAYLDYLTVVGLKAKK